MKKYWIVILVILVLVTGCAKEESKSNEKTNENSKPTEQEVINNNEDAVQPEDANNENNSVNENETSTDKTENISSNQVQPEPTTGSEENNSNPETPPQTNETSPSTPTVVLGQNEYISLKDNQIHKYTFTYPDLQTCSRNGDGEPYDIVYPVRPYIVFGCEEVKDANGNILWGEFFYEHTDENSKFYY